MVAKLSQNLQPLHHMDSSTMLLMQCTTAMPKCDSRVSPSREKVKASMVRLKTVISPVLKRFLVSDKAQFSPRKIPTLYIFPHWFSWVYFLLPPCCTWYHAMAEMFQHCWVTISVMPQTNIIVNSLRPSDAYMRRWSGPWLVQIIDCRLFGAKPLPKPITYLIFYSNPHGANESIWHLLLSSHVWDFQEQ